MKSQKELAEHGGEPADETDALRLSDLAENEGARIEFDEYGTDDDLWPVAKSGRRRLAFAAAALVLVAGAVVGGKIAYDRRRSAKGYQRAVTALEDAREALLSAASELPERGREVLQKVKRH
ncbi:hypothetical protein O1R50_09390 [Glycomyces luteolus]|uniref:Uncharacterized protein n=1 Tax=Glycomyces luteolus TaxID=2670330 RepID=A0A9X3PAP4_9ACTN|nr:hypothetical protein [Glycomyces luteolus]MDA1359835.1 hypothetical protein [Glycomyces luteolus]